MELVAGLKREMPRIKQRDYTIPVRLNQQTKMSAPKRRIETSLMCRFPGLFVTVSSLVAIFISNSALCDNIATSSIVKVNDITRKPEVQKTSTKLISALEAIERQHMKMNQMKPFGSKRPSKFDSGEELTSEYHHSSLILAPDSAGEDPMKSILSMHRQASLQQQQQQQLLNNEHSKSGSRWQEVKNSVKSASNLVNSNKVISQVFSYMSPLVSGTSKLMEHQGKVAPTLIPSDKKNNDSHVSLSSRLHSIVNPYVARSINSHLLGESVQKGKLNAFVTPQPLSSFLSRPSNQEVVTQPSSQLISIDSVKDLAVEDSNMSSTRANNKFINNYIQDSFRGLLALSQLPILSGRQISTAPSVLETSTQKPNSSNATSSLIGERQRKWAMEELYRYAYILGSGVRRKKDPLIALSSNHHISPSFANQANNFNYMKAVGGLSSSQQGLIKSQAKRLKSIVGLMSSPQEAGVSATKKATPRGVMWDMATDPSLAVTVFHLLEKASVALPLGFLLMPFVQMIRNPFNGIGLARILPPRASHRSVDYEELAKRLDIVDKMLSKALRSAHRDSYGFMGGK